MSEWYTGSPIVFTVDVDPFSNDTDAAVVVTSPAGDTFTPDASTDDDGATWQATLPGSDVDSPGEWDAVWTVTGTGAGVKPYTVAVAPLPNDVPAGVRVYATTADLAKYLHAAPPAGSRRRLIAASQFIEDATRTAVYAVDTDSMPTDAAVIRAFRDAVCAQAEWWETTGDQLGDAALWGDVSIGSVRMARTQTLAGTRPANARLAPAAEEILRVAGLRNRAAGNTRGYVSPSWSGV